MVALFLRKMIRSASNSRFTRNEAFDWLASRFSVTSVTSELGFSCAEFAVILIASAVISAIGAFFAMRLLFDTGQAVLFAVVCSVSVSLGTYALPFLAAQRNEKRLETELPIFLASVISEYAQRPQLATALERTVWANDMRIAKKCREALALFRAGMPARIAFGELFKRDPRSVSRSFSLIADGLETGQDVSRALESMMKNASASLDLDEDRRTKLGMASWVISASSAFFFPLFGALGLSMMSVLQKLSFARAFSLGDESVIRLSIFGYLFLGVVLDAGYNGRVRFASFSKGVLAFTPVFMLVAVFVFIFASKLAGTLAG